MNPRIHHPCIVVLAAGSSSRLGKPKQLLAYGDESMLQHAAGVAISSGIGPVLVVTGAHQSSVEKDLHGLPVKIVYNPDWEEGMGASIRCGAEAAVARFPNTDGILFMVCDQPYVFASHLQHLLETQVETLAPIVASSYDGVRGTPALFHQTIFEELLALRGDQGARPILQRHANLVASVPFSEGGVDIDTASDYSQFLNSAKPDQP
jgi:molybdenum cofactor cytidylyltransferase